MIAAEFIAKLRDLPPDTILAVADGGVFCHVSPDLMADQWGVACIHSTSLPVTEEDIS